MSLDRLFLVCGWDPYGRRLGPKHYRDRETAEHVARFLRACGFRVKIVTLCTAA